MSRWPLLAALAALACLALAAGVVLLGPGSRPQDSAQAAATPTPAGIATQPPAPTPTPEPVVYVAVHLPEPLLQTVNAQASALARELGLTLRQADGASAAGVVIALDDGAGAGPTAVLERWVPVASAWSLRDALDPGDPAAVPLLLPSERREELESLLGPALAKAAAWLPQAGVRPTLEADPDAVALLPLAALGGGQPLRLLAASEDGQPWLEQRVRVHWSDERWWEFGVALAARLDTPAPALTTVAFTGDIMVGRCVYERQRNLDDFTAAFEHVAGYLRGMDIAVGSLDGAMSDAGTPYGCEETFNLLGPARAIEGFAAAGFDVVSLATNHAKDCGSTGFVCGNQTLRDSIALLRGAGIAPVGAGEDLAEARAPAIVERNGIRFAFLAYDDVAWTFYGATETAPGTAPLTEEALRADVAHALSLADVVIVLPHWGVEYTPYPTPRQRALAAAAIEAGATLVVGNHPHVVQAAESGEGWFTAYALGNFSFDQDWSLETQQGAVLEATFAGARLIGVRLKPVRIVNMFQPTFVEGAEALQILDRMRAASE